MNIDLNMIDGFTRLFRSIWKYGYHRNDRLMFSLLIWFQQHAAWRDIKVFNKGQVIELKRGQVLFGRDELAHEFNTTSSKIRSRIESMKNIGFLTTKTTSRGTIGTVVNYDKYQSTKDSCQEKQPTESPAESPGHRQQIATNKELKEDKEEKQSEKFSDDSVELKMSEYLWGLISERLPNRKKPRLQNWAQHMDYILRIDKRPPEEVQNIIAFSQQDDFWQDNILSTSKLREKYDTLFARFQKSEFKKHIEEYTYNNPIWKKIINESELTEDQVKKINDDIRRRQKEDDRRQDEKSTPGGKEKWEKMRSKISQKMSI